MKNRATFPIEQSGQLSINLKWISICIVWRFAQSKVANESGNLCKEEKYFKVDVFIDGSKAKQTAIKSSLGDMPAKHSKSQG